jgi:hypothetical protein
MLRLFRRKMVFVVKYFRRNHFLKNNFLENIFRRLVRTKKLQKEKMQLSPESGNVQSPLPDSGEHVWSDPTKIAGFRSDSSGSSRIMAILARSGLISGPIQAILDRSDRIHPNPTGPRPFWPDPVGSIAGSGQIRPDSCRLLTMAECRRILAPTIFRWSDVAGFRCRLNSDNRLLPDSGNRISNVHARTNNLISENDLRFLKP